MVGKVRLPADDPPDSLPLFECVIDFPGMTVSRWNAEISCHGNEAGAEPGWKV